MKSAFFVAAALLATTAAMAADKPATKPKPCPKGQVTTTSKMTGDQVCFGMQMTIGPMVPVTKAKPAPKKSAP